jgi:hypothetical protein
VSSSGFSNEAQRKASTHGIDTITAEEARQVDWTARIAAEFFTIMTHSNMLLWIGAFSENGTEVERPQIIAENIQHKDSTSEKLFPALYSYFVQHVQERADQAISAKIAENWQRFFSDSTPRYCEMNVDKVQAEINLDGRTIRIDRLVFGCGTKFYFRRADVDSVVLGQHMLSRVTVGAIAEKEFQISIITGREQGVVSVEVHGGELSPHTGVR